METSITIQHEDCEKVRTPLDHFNMRQVDNMDIVSWTTETIVEGHDFSVLFAHLKQRYSLRSYHYHFSIDIIF